MPKSFLERGWLMMADAYAAGTIPWPQEVPVPYFSGHKQQRPAFQCTWCSSTCYSNCLSDQFKANAVSIDAHANLPAFIFPIILIHSTTDAAVNIYSSQHTSQPDSGQFMGT